MSALNFLNKTFSKITLDNKTNKKINEKNNKKMDGEIGEKMGGKLIKFNHGVMIKLKKGIYKGYNGYVLEYYPETVDVKFEYTNNVLVKNYISRFDKNMVEIKDEKVVVKRGEYKGKVGEIIKINKARLTIHIDALNKTISKHVVCDKLIIKERNVEIDDVFYYDIILKGGITITVTKITDDMMYGYDKDNNVVTFKECDIEKYLPGFKILKQKGEVESKCIENNEDIFISENQQEEEEEHKYEEGQEDEGEVMGYERNDINENEKVNIENEKNNTDELELKVSFKDMERCEFVSQKLSKDETEIMNSIDKVIKLLNYPTDIINKYSLLEKIMGTIKVMRNELERVNITKWKKSDIKYIVLYLIIVEVVKKRELHITYNTFTSQIEKLYNIGYFIKSDVMGSCFLITEKENADIINTCFGLVVLSEEESKKMRVLYKDSKYLEIMIRMIENCGDILQEWYGKIDLKGCKKVDVKIYNVAEGRRNKEYPKYFLTTKDILNGNIPETSKKIVWGPQSEYLVNIWKTGLNKKMMSCNSDEKKSIYEYVINNFDNAPFMRDYIPSNEVEKIKYTELMKTFVKFVGQLREYVDMKKNEKMCKLNERNIEKERVNNKRREFSELRGLEEGFDNIELKEQKGNKKLKVKF